MWLSGMPCLDGPSLDSCMVIPQNKQGLDPRTFLLPLAADTKTHRSARLSCIASAYHLRAPHCTLHIISRLLIPNPCTGYTHSGYAVLAMKLYMFNTDTIYFPRMSGQQLVAAMDTGFTETQGGLYCTSHCQSDLVSLKSHPSLPGERLSHMLPLGL